MSLISSTSFKYQNIQCNGNFSIRLPWYVKQKRKKETQYEFIYYFEVKSFLLFSSFQICSHKLEAFCFRHSSLAACFIKFVTIYCCALHFVHIRSKNQKKKIKKLKTQRQKIEWMKTFYRHWSNSFSCLHSI